MYTPTEFQAHLLRAVQNLAFDTAQKRNHNRITPIQAAQIDIVDSAGAQIEAAALAIGIPRPWVDYARIAGGQGQRWHPRQQMLSGRHATRSELLTAHTARIRELQKMAATAAAYPPRMGAGPDAVAKVRQVLGITWQRAGAIGHALALTRDERHQCWQPGPQQWSAAVAAAVNTLDDTALAARWEAMHTSDFTPLAMPIMVLQGAGITHDDIARQLPLSPDQMVEHAAIALFGAPEPRSLDTTIAGTSRTRGGGLIATAIDAAALTTPSGAAGEFDATTTAPPGPGSEPADIGPEP
ncbi:hypothetical protein [Nocardia fusca]|uniref:hypothetical protein n=1 Tax=Nocardia fusca TaxID=941183 RepID=UPI0007A74146|nr:hypothetical protein [Nocardia fusca]